MTSVYKTDFGNGVVIYADDYVKTGEWVYDCEYSRLIRRQPFPIPIAELEQFGSQAIINTYLSDGADKARATEAIEVLTDINGWYKKLHYIDSSLSEGGNIIAQSFGLIGQHNGLAWALTVRHRLNFGEASFQITAEPYDPETYMDHAKMLQAAAKSCPVPQ
jgi:hypothetical protein